MTFREIVVFYRYIFRNLDKFNNRTTFCLRTRYGEDIHILSGKVTVIGQKNIFLFEYKEEQCKPFARFIIVHDSKMHSCFKRETSSYLVKIVII